MRLIKKANMNVVYAHENFPATVTKTIFLAGPTPRSSDVQSWRPEAINILNSLGYDGHIFVPEPRDGKFAHTYDEQIDWEITAMKRADIIVFWIPRNLETMPAFTTNVEFGKWIDSGKVVVGFPSDAEKVRYLENLAHRYDVTVFSSLEETLNKAIELIGEGSNRTDGEVEIPLMIWNTKSFQDWYNSQKQAENKLVHADVKWTFRVGPNKNIVFLWIVHTDIFIASENRHKTNEFVISRTSTSSIVMYKKEEDLMNTNIVLVREFRSPANTKDGFIWEIPGGSSFNPNEDILNVAADEIFEETGLRLDKERITYVQRRQSSGTLLANKIALFSIEITEDELNWLKSQKGIAKGKIEDTERTYVEILTLKEILDNELVDWSNIGMIMKVLN